MISGWNLYVHNPLNPRFGFKRMRFINMRGRREGYAYWVYLGLVDLCIKVR